MRKVESTQTLQRRFLSFKDVQKITGLSRSTIYRQIERGHFPKPKMLSIRKVGFQKSELENWIEERKAA